MTMLEDLRECPFCGGEAELTWKPCDLPGFDGKSWSASCRGDVDADCFASTYAQFKKREYAIEAWNKRTHAAQIEQDARDAERYRWLNENPEHENFPYYEDDMWHLPYLVNNAGGAGGGVGRASFDTLGEAIDAAMAKESGNG